MSSIWKTYSTRLEFNVNQIQMIDIIVDGLVKEIGFDIKNDTENMTYYEPNYAAGSIAYIPLGQNRFAIELKSTEAISYTECDMIYQAISDMATLQGEPAIVEFSDEAQDMGEKDYIIMGMDFKRSDIYFYEAIAIRRRIEELERRERSELERYFEEKDEERLKFKGVAYA